MNQCSVPSDFGMFLCIIIIENNESGIKTF
jgi:hypothetical protein